MGRYDEYIECLGGCQARHHLACVGLKVEQLVDMKKSGEIKLWKCINGCQETSEVAVENVKAASSGAHFRTLSDSAAAASPPCDRCEALVGYFSGVVDRLERRVSEEMAAFKSQLIVEMKSLLGTNSTILENIQANLANCFSPPANRISDHQPSSDSAVRETVVGASYAHVVSNRCSVVIKPKDDRQSNAATKTDLLRTVDPVTSNVNVAKIKHIKGGGLFVSCSSREAAAKLSKEAADKLAGNYTIREAKTPNPRIRIVGMSENHDNDAFLNYVKMQNSQVFADGSEPKVVSFGPIKSRKASSGSRRQEVFQAVIQLSISAYNSALSNGQLFIGYDCCSVYDAIDVTRCYNCCGYHHISANCKSKTVCPRCSGDHSVRDCSSETLKCVNCLNAQKTAPAISCDHAAWDRGCTVHQQKLTSLKADILCLK